MSDIYSKAKVMVFLGAGASAALGMPTSKKFHKFIEDNYHWPANRLRAMCADYLRSIGRGEYSPEQIDAEDLRDCLVSMEKATEALASLKNESSPPLSKLPGNPAGAFEYVSAMRQKFDEIIRQTYKGVPEKAAYQHYHILLQRLWSWGANILPIFTTNYDLVLESYAGHHSHPIKLVDGSSPGHSSAEPSKLDTTLFDTSKNAPNTVLFFKLHGSTTWFKHEEKNEVILLPFGTNPLPKYDNLLIYPTKGKGEILKDYPFSEYYIYLKRYLESESVRLCIVIGYSFGDSAINEHFKTAIKRGMRLLIIDPNPDAARLITSEIGLTSNQYHVCPTGFTNNRWDTHIKSALGNELKILSS